ncbi:PREDICTED: uncharacterized protein LOC109462801 [Branchiostoma belcheri]|uniref:Uncharacterized protein LOC109462801 n=1 Tax=Branchiostoma belcheri TaxID=7741 RepID=A0A6P4Y849_BRABE|nr:PREDICTED: uncharacterized protein LOC109462801 [Branchiostoma belcheri]
MDPAMADMFKGLIQTCFGEYSAKYRRTEEGLRRVLQTKYSDNVDEFRQRFAEPTLQLLTTLRNQGFPLSTSKYRLVHLVSPDVPCEAGDMFFQVGQSNPGTLSLKFTKYDNVQNVIRLKNSHVPERDYRTAFTDQYFRDLRTLASQTGNIGDVLMRTCIVVTGDGTVARVGTSTVMEEINMNVISSMTPEQKQAIADKLDRDPVLRTSGSRDDWQALAGRLEAEGTLEEGFAAKLNACVAQGSPTMKLLEMLCRSDPNYPTARLVEHLRQLKRNDAVEAFNHSNEAKRRKDFQKNRAHTVNLGELAMGLPNTKLSREESGSDPCLPDSADKLHSDAEGNLAGELLSRSCPHGVLQRSNTVPTTPLQERQPTSVPVQPVSGVQEQTKVPVQAVDQPKELSSPQQASQQQEDASEPVTIDLHVGKMVTNDLQATPEYPLDHPDNPAYPEVQAAVTSSQRTFQNPQPMAAHENWAVKSHNGQTLEHENNPSYPPVSEAVTGPTASDQVPVATGNSNGSIGTGLVSQTATLTNQEYPSVERAVQAN